MYININSITLGGINMLDVVWGYILVFLLAAVPFFESAVVTPVAILAGLSAIPVFILAIGGNLITVYIVIVFIEKVKRWRKKEDDGKRTGRAKKIWDKYGLPGLTLLGPFFVGSHLTAFLALLFGGTKKQVSIWITISIAAWSLLLGLLVYFGIDWFNVENKFLENIFNQAQ